MFARLAVLATLASSAFATVYVTNPIQGSQCAGNAACTVAWQESGDAPTLAQFGPAVVGLYVGSEFQQSELQRISSSVDVSTTASVSFTVDPSIGEDSSDYFIRFTSIKGKNGSNPYEVFSAKFTLTGMSGKFNATIKAQIAAEESEISSQASASAASSTPGSSSGSSTSGSSTAKSTASSSGTTSAASSTSSTSSAGRVEILSGVTALAGAAAMLFSML